MPIKINSYRNYLLTIIMLIVYLITIVGCNTTQLESNADKYQKNIEKSPDISTTTSENNQKIPEPAYVYTPNQGVYAQKGVDRINNRAISITSRASWSSEKPLIEKMNLMNGVNKITIHHEGSERPNNDQTPQQVASKLRLIQKQHKLRMKAGDIGYHYIIDRSGNIWQGRDSKFQGAHSSGANNNNIGIMLMGNFDIQQPTPQQLVAMEKLVIILMKKYRISGKMLFMHSDLGKTKCPGKNLALQVNSLKARLAY